jgi:hypothetical protein
VASCCECGDEPSGSCATELVTCSEITNCHSTCLITHFIYTIEFYILNLLLLQLVSGLKTYANGRVLQAVACLALVQKAADEIRDNDFRSKLFGANGACCNLLRINKHFRGRHCK